MKDEGARSGFEEGGGEQFTGIGFGAEPAAFTITRPGGDSERRVVRAQSIPVQKPGFEGDRPVLDCGVGRRPFYAFANLDIFLGSPDRGLIEVRDPIDLLYDGGTVVNEEEAAGMRAVSPTIVLTFDMKTIVGEFEERHPELEKAVPESEERFFAEEWFLAWPEPEKSIFADEPRVTVGVAEYAAVTLPRMAELSRADDESSKRPQRFEWDPEGHTLTIRSWPVDDLIVFLRHP